MLDCGRLSPCAPLLLTTIRASASSFALILLEPKDTGLSVLAGMRSCYDDAVPVFLVYRLNQWLP